MEKIKHFFNSVIAFFVGIFKALFGSKKEKIRNKNLLKRGGYAIAIIAVVIAVAVGLNVLVESLGDRFDLKFDLTSDGRNSVSEENEAFLKNVNKPVVIYVLAADEKDYASYIGSYATEYYKVAAKNSDYYNQFGVLLNRYSELNENITVKYMDPYGPEMSKLLTEYQITFNYGDLLVTSQFKDKEGIDKNNYKLVTYHDIYLYEDTSGMASYGYDYYYVTGSKLEFALTSAIANVTSEETRKVGFLAAHSRAETFDYYRNLLSHNSFEVTDISGDFLTSVPSEQDALIICSPSKDFTSEEIDILSRYLENDGSYGKALIFYGDSAFQDLPNLYSFLEEWGITIEKGIVFETDATLRNSPSNYVSYGYQDETGVATSQAYLSGYNIPMYENGNGYSGRETKTVIGTNGTSVVMPIGSNDDTKIPENAEKRKLSSAVISEEKEIKDNVTVKSYVIAFSSIDFISKTYCENYASVVNYTGTALNAMRYGTGMGEAEIGFDIIDKTLESTSELYATSEKASSAVFAVCVIIVPLALIVLSVVIQIRRRNK